ncbi:MAG TPA: zf-HC2 domain-containing protein [Candidatus Acidoferrales bacterium]|nr:zf-HC2 domain-containing protein [Candidatus Acidoferrales bacterium]
MKKLNCNEVVDNLSCYVDGDGAADLRAGLESHILRCGRCRAILESTRQTLQILHDCEPFPVPLQVSARLYSRLQEVLYSK